MVPQPPGDVSDAERVFLAQANTELTRKRRGLSRWYAGLAAAAGLLIAVSLVQFRGSTPVTVAEARPTITDVLHAAQAGEPQHQVDLLAMAAVRVSASEVAQ